MPVYASTTASRALTPWSGAAAAWLALPKILDRQLAHAQRQLHHLRPVAGMDQHGGIRPGEDPGLDQRDLAAALFLCRASDQEHRPRRAIQDGPHRQRGAERGGPDQVVAAGMPQAGERIILRHERDPRPARSRQAGERGWEIGHAPRHRETVLLQNVGE